MEKKWESNNSNPQVLEQKNTPKGGNTSTTEIRDGVFVKYVLRKKYDYRVDIFQTRLYYNIPDLNGFEINKGLVAENQDYTDDFVECHYEIVNEKDWELNKESTKVIAENMAKIHNYCYDERDRIDLPVKTNMYNSLEEWENLVKLGKVSKDDFNIRKRIFKDIKGINEKQVKIPLHRDFRKHNILWDGTRYVLIDFDFAAHDFVSLEIMAFVSDLLDEDEPEKSLKLIETFFKNYKKFSIIDCIIYKDLVSDYLNYLCVNTFPMYLKDNIPEENFNELIKQRNETLLKLYKYKIQLDKIITLHS